MKVKALFIVGQMLVQTIAFGSDFNNVGTLEKTENGQFQLLTSNGISNLDLTAEALKGVPSLVGKVKYVEIKAADQVPTIASGDLSLEGIMSKDEHGYLINGQRVVYGPSKKVTGGEFNDQSREYFVGKQVRALGTIGSADLFVISSIIRDDAFTADTTPLIDKEIPAEFVAAFNHAPIDFVSDLLNRKIKSPSPAWFRGTVFTEENFKANEGDAVLILTASGGQNDSIGAVNGHFASGLGHVGSDLKIKGEMFNVYVTNEKEIVPGDIDMNDYFGQLISGQLNYRPTYELVIYGIDEAKILKVKAELDRFHPLFRDGSTKITADKNCVTMSTQALADIGFYGEQRNKSPNSFKFLSQQTGLPKPLSKKKELEYALKTPVAEFMPGPAFVSFLKNINYLNEKENLGIKRVDFIFGGQTPSNRPNGLPPTKDVSDNFLRQAEIAKDIGLGKIKNKISTELK